MNKFKIGFRFYFSVLKVIHFLILFFVSIMAAYAQHLEKQQNDVIKIITDNCIKCHYSNDFGNLNFSNPDNVYFNSSLIKYVVSKAIMPPWRADTSFHCFINDRRLKPEEIKAIEDWIPTVNKIKNKSTKKQSIKGNDLDYYKKPDLILSLPKPFKIQDNNKDVFVTYLLKTNLKVNKYISAIAIKPSNKKELHHARVEIDSSGFFNKKINTDGYFETSSIENESDIALLNSKPIAIYLPGLFYNKFPKGTAYPLSVKDKIILHLHYAPSTIEQEDQTEVWIYYSDVPNPNIVVYNNGRLNDYSIILPPDSITTVSFKSTPLNNDFTIFALQLHMHLLGKSIKLEAVTPSNDTINLLNIPNWDFNWQEYYYYNKMVTIPKGSVFITTSVFDNTNENPNNPNIPTKAMNFYGMDTKNEMMGYICLGFYNDNPIKPIEIKVSDY